MFYLGRCSTQPPPRLGLVHLGSLNNTDSHLVPLLQIALQPLKILVGAAIQTSHSKIQLLTLAAAAGLTKNPTQRRCKHAWPTNTCGASLLTIYVNFECQHN